MHPDDWATLASQLLVTGAAVLVVMRRRAHRVGRLLMAFAALSLLQEVSAIVAYHGLDAHVGSVPGAAYLASFSEASQRLVIGLSLELVLVFPDGRLPSARWRPVALAIGGVFSAWFAYHLFAPTELVEDPFNGLANRFGVAWVGDPPLSWLRFVFLPTAGALAVCVLASVPGRFRRSRGEERQQLKVVGLAFLGITLGLVALVVSAAVAPSLMNAVGFVFSVCLWTVLPLAVVIAMIRYRLYDVDLVINRTLVYGLLSVVVLGSYTAVALLVGRVMATTGWSAPVPVAVATLVAASLVSPGRRRIQREIDRCFARRRYDAVRLVENVVRHRRGIPYRSGEVTEVLAAALNDPSLEVHYWLREGRTYVDADGTPVQRPDGDSDRVVTVVMQDGEPVAALTYSPVVGRQPTLVAAVARAGMLLLENARLRAEVSVQLAEVQQSRARIVDAADRERQRVERDLHDGAQQRLVALALRVKLAQRGSPTRAPLTRDQVVALTVCELNAIVADLRELARGIAPAALVDDGLGAALDELAARTPTPVVVTVAARRYSAAVERTIYYAACEAITNAVKHASAGEVVVDVRETGGSVRLTVADDGCGGADAANGSGLSGLGDRVEAVGGMLTVDSPPGGGTVLAVEVPCAS
jgi:signal transduction histidine kinase